MPDTPEHLHPQDKRAWQPGDSIAITDPLVAWDIGCEIGLLVEVDFITGYVYLPCRNALRAAERRRKHERLLARIAAGEVILCSRCHKRPRYHTGRHVYDYCWPCYYQMQRDSRRRHIAAKFRSIITKEAS